MVVQMRAKEGFKNTNITDDLLPTRNGGSHHCIHLFLVCMS